jgi:hypothetical protein
MASPPPPVVASVTTAFRLDQHLERERERERERDLAVASNKIINGVMPLWEAGDIVIETDRLRICGHR